MKKKILLVIDGLEFGGGERVFIQIADGLRDSFDMCAAAMPGGIFEDEIRKLGIKFYPVNMSRRFSLKSILQLRHVIVSNKIDLVHSQGARADFFTGIAGIIAGKAQVIKTLAVPVEGFDVGNFRKAFYQVFDRIIQRYVKSFIVVSEYLKSFLIEKRGIPSHKIVRIYNGVELSRYCPSSELNSLRNNLGISKNVPLIGTVGRMVWVKGFEYMIIAVPKIKEKVPEAKFLFVGEGPLKKNMEDFAERIRLKESAIFTGYQSDIRDILEALDILVVPSIREGFPMITLEAMAMKKPIVATHIPGITEQITDGKEGILVPPKNPEAIAKAVLKLLGDKGLQVRLGEAARKKVEKEFSVEKMIQETERVYSSILETNQK